jgi:hypothetical protein
MGEMLRRCAKRFWQRTKPGPLRRCDMLVHCEAEHGAKLHCSTSF